MRLVAVTSDEAAEPPLQSHERLGEAPRASHALRPEKLLLEEADLARITVMPHGAQHLGELLERLRPEIRVKMLGRLPLKPSNALLSVGRRATARCS
jgi:hypothetical protein